MQYEKIVQSQGPLAKFTLARDRTSLKIHIDATLEERVWLESLMEAIDKLIRGHEVVRRTLRGKITFRRFEREKDTVSLSINSGHATRFNIKNIHDPKNLIYTSANEQLEEGWEDERDEWGD